jgi:hypothetical protein
MEMPKLTETHRKLQKLVGRFQADEKIYASPMGSAGKAAARTVGSRISGGFGVAHEYQQKKDGAVAYSGHGVFRYDSASGEYQLHWFDSMDMGVNLFHGNFEGEVLSMTCSDAQGHMRCIYDLGVPDGYHMRMEMSQDGISWAPFMEGHFTEAKAATSRKARKRKQARRPTATKKAKRKRARRK